MATIETRYSVGDQVFWASTTVERKQHPCPDCRGSRKWKAVSPAGHEYEVTCPRCAAGYQSDQSLSLDYSAHEPQVRALTVGSVRFNSWGSDGGAEYMCDETVVGSGQVYAEAQLYPTEAEARAAAEALAAVRNADQGSWVKQRYDASLKFCDYELHDASLRAARDLNVRRQVDLGRLFGDLRYTLEDAEVDRGTTVTDLVETLRKTIDEFKFRDE